MERPRALLVVIVSAILAVAALPTRVEGGGGHATSERYYQTALLPPSGATCLLDRTTGSETFSLHPGAVCFQVRDGESRMQILIYDTIGSPGFNNYAAIEYRDAALRSIGEDTFCAWAPDFVLPAGTAFVEIVMVPAPDGVPCDTSQSRLVTAVFWSE